jgi:hypothetical protein
MEDLPFFDLEQSIYVLRNFNKYTMQKNEMSQQQLNLLDWPDSVIVIKA